MVSVLVFEHWTSHIPSQGGYMEGVWQFAQPVHMYNIKLKKKAYNPLRHPEGGARGILGRWSAALDHSTSVVLEQVFS